MGVKDDTDRAHGGQQHGLNRRAKNKKRYEKEQISHQQIVPVKCIGSVQCKRREEGPHLFFIWAWEKNTFFFLLFMIKPHAVQAIHPPSGANNQYSAQ